MNELFDILATPAAVADPATKSRQAAYLHRVPIKSRGIVGKAFAEACSPRQAIKAKCLDCGGFDRDEVRLCTVATCPLCPWRPYQRDGADGG
jgi:hypothetical protein